MANQGTGIETRRGGRWTLMFWGLAACLLLLPFIAMRLSADGVNWTASDFIFMAVLLGLIGLALELAARKGNAAYNMATGLALAASFFLIVLTGAVGIIGDEGEIANLLFGIVILVALLGAVAARFRPGGMARAMAAAALVQLLVPVAALILRPGAAAAIWSPEVPISTLVFAAIWLGAARLYRKAAAL
jgi:hypothetical protein